MSAELNVLNENQPQADRCRSLLCKGMFIHYYQGDPPYVTGDGNYWCGKTQRIYGPDDQFVGDGECRHTGRSCYETPS